MLKSERLLNEGLRFHQAGQFAQAEGLYRQVLAHSPRHPQAAALLGTLCNQTNRHAEGAALLQSAVALAPSVAENWVNLGNSLKALSQATEAEQAYRQAIHLKPNFAPGYNGLASALQPQGRFEEAECALRDAIRLAPTYSEAYANLGICLMRACQYDQAVISLRQALQLNARLDLALANLAVASAYASNVSVPEYVATVRQWHDRFIAPLRRPVRPHENERSFDRPLRIAYLSADFDTHSVSYFFRPIMAAHNRRDFVIHCYSDVERPDEVTAELRKSADVWRDVRPLDADGLEECVRADRIDILVDLAGFSSAPRERNRMGVLARKAAPVQVTMIGYPDTTAIGEIEYRVTDATCDLPGAADELNVERLVRMPEVAWVYRPPDELPPEPAPRAADEPVIFGSITHLMKVNQQVLDAWARILKLTPRSRLVIQAVELKLEERRQRLTMELEARGARREQFELREPTDFQTYLRMIASLDLVLDTFPFNGGTTSYHALAVGTPVVTLAGDRHASRMGASVLRCVGLDELIASDVEGYVEIASRLGNAPAELRTLRHGLRERVLKSPLCDGTRYTGHLERAYRQMWRRWCAGEPASAMDMR